MMNEAAMVSIRVMDAYPTEKDLDDGSSVTIDLVRREDQQALRQLFHRITQARPSIIEEEAPVLQTLEGWIESPDYAESLPLLATRGGRVVGFGLLQPAGLSRPAGTAKVQVVADPEFRNLGLGKALVEEFTASAREMGVKYLVCELVADKGPRAMRAAQRAGLLRLSVLDDGLTILEQPLGRWRN